jgi:hypothetical protein
MTPTSQFRVAMPQRNFPTVLLWLCCVLFQSFLLAPRRAQADFLGYYALSNSDCNNARVGNFLCVNTNADGFLTVLDEPLSIILTGGNNGWGGPGQIDLLITAPAAGMVSFAYSYFFDFAADDPGWDYAGYLLGETFVGLAYADGDSGTIAFQVQGGERFGWRVATLDNSGEPARLMISSFTAPAGDPPPAVPEPGTLALGLAAAAVLAAGRKFGRLARPSRTRAGITIVTLIAATLAAAGSGWAQTPSYYSGTNITGQLYLARTTNMLQSAQTLALRTMGAKAKPQKTVAEPPPRAIKLLRPPLFDKTDLSVSGAATLAMAAQSLPLLPPAGGFGFDGLTHLQQLSTNNGNQFSVEPPNPSIAVGHGYILEGVNNAVQVYTTSGAPLLPKAISSNELFGLPAAIDRQTGVNGAFPTDMRVYYDSTIARWFVLQRAQDYDVNGIPLSRSHLYIAVSQTPDPTGTYNIYEMDTTNSGHAACPCIADYPQIGADQYGFYISVNEYDTATEQFQDAAILAVSKMGLLAGTTMPTLYRFLIPYTTGFEFAIQPAATPPGASPYIANGGMEYFVSSQSASGVASSVAVWAMYNTASLAGPNPLLTLTRITVPSLTYYLPGKATQKDGPLPYGSTLYPPGVLAYLDGNDTRILSATYAGGRLFATLATQVYDESNRGFVGGAYFILSPTFRGELAARMLRQGYILAANNHVLRPAVAVNPQGRGAIAFTLSGPDYYPSAAYLPIDVFTTGQAIQVAGLGAFPDDGFTCYPGGFLPGTGRWGDYATAVADNDGTVWMVAEYIPNANRSTYVNWGTFVYRYQP